MTSGEPLTQREKEPSAIGEPTATGCQSCIPGQLHAAKRVTEQPGLARGDWRC